MREGKGRYGAACPAASTWAQRPSFKVVYAFSKADGQRVRKLGARRSIWRCTQPRRRRGCGIFGTLLVVVVVGVEVRSRLRSCYVYPSHLFTRMLIR